MAIKMKVIRVQHVKKSRKAQARVARSCNLITQKKLSSSFLKDLPIHENLEITGNLSRKEIY